MIFLIIHLKKIFGCKFATLEDKLINTTSKEENQDNAVKIVLEINEALTSDKDNND